MNNNMFKKMIQKSLPSIMAITVTMFGLVFPGSASAITVTVDGIRMAGEYTAPPLGTNSGTDSLLWWNGHHSIYDKASGNTNDLYWEINDNSGLFSLNLFFEVPTYARRMIWAAGCEYTGPGSDDDCNAIPDEYLNAYQDGSHHTIGGTPSVKMDYDTQTGSEFFKLNDGDTSIVKTFWQDEDSTVDNFTWATSREYLIDQGICTTLECLQFDMTASIEMMWSGLGSKAEAKDLLDSITDMELHLSDEAVGLIPPEIIPPEVPVPAAFWLFGSGLLGLVGMARRKQKV
jgi:hypothetical protein